MIEQSGSIVLDTKNKTLGIESSSNSTNTKSTAQIETTTFAGGDPSTSVRSSTNTVSGSGASKVIIGSVHGPPPLSGLVSGVSETPNSYGGCDKCSAQSLGIPIYAVDKKNIHKVDQSAKVTNGLSKQTNGVKDALNTYGKT